MYILCSDLESVFLPELWVEIANETGIKDLQLTTRDVSDVNLLMQKRITSLRENGVDFETLIQIAKKSEPLEGAVDFLRWAREMMPMIILSDTFWEFVSPIISKMEYPTIICNSLQVDKEGFVSGYNLREDGKRKTIEVLQQAGLKVITVGDSYNDVKMLEKADKGVFFNASSEIVQQFPEFSSVNSYEELKLLIKDTINSK